MVKSTRADVINQILKCVCDYVSVGRRSFQFAGKMFHIIEVTPAESYVECDGEDACIRVFKRDGDITAMVG